MLDNWDSALFRILVSFVFTVLTRYFILDFSRPGYSHRRAQFYSRLDLLMYRRFQIEIKCLNCLRKIIILTSWM